MIVVTMLAKKLKKETEIVPTLVAVIGIIEYFAILFQIWMCIIFDAPRYLAFTLGAFGIQILLNIYNWYYIKNSVSASDAMKKEKLSQKKVKQLSEEFRKKQKRKEAYDRMMNKYEAGKSTSRTPLLDDQNEGGMIEMIELYDDLGESISQNGSDQEQFEGGDKKTKFSEQFLLNNKIYQDGEDFYIEKMIEDKGFNKWVNAYDQTAKIIKWVSLICTFKFYRMSYSYFMGRKQFLVLYQKKKFKKHTVTMTMLS